VPEIGYALSSEEHRADDLVRFAKRAEEVGFPFAMISDHFHPWTDRQGQSPFVWSVIGGIATQTERLRLGTGVTCPTIRIHPAIIAQAAATSGQMSGGRFFLGVGSGEHLNEHVLGDKWPEFEVRLEMLEEAIEVMRLLWEGGRHSFYGQYYSVENARIYSLPEQPVEIYVAASGPEAAELAGRVGDGLITTKPSKEIVDAFREAGGKGKPVIGQATLCWAEDEAQARRTAYEIWPNAGIEGQASQELPVPAHFEQLAKMITEETLAESIPCGPNPTKVLESIQEYADAGIDRVYLHQIGPDQEGFFEFARREILPQFAPVATR